MIDPWKFNPLTDLGKKAGTLVEMSYIKYALSKEPLIKGAVLDFIEKLESGEETITDSKELFL